MQFFSKHFYFKHVYMLQHHTVYRCRCFSRGTIFFTMHAFYPFIFLPAKPAIITQSVEHLLIHKNSLLQTHNTLYIHFCTIHPCKCILHMKVSQQDMQGASGTNTITYYLLSNFFLHKEVMMTRKEEDRKNIFILLLPPYI